MIKHIFFVFFSSFLMLFTNKLHVYAPVKLTTVRRFKLTMFRRLKLTTAGRCKLTI